MLNFCLGCNFVLHCIQAGIGTIVTAQVMLRYALHLSAVARTPDQENSGSNPVLCETVNTFFSLYIVPETRIHSAV